MFQIHLMNILSPFVESLGLYKCENEISDLGSNDSIWHGSEYNMTNIFLASHILLTYFRAFRGVKQQQNMRNEENIDLLCEINVQ